MNNAYLKPSPIEADNGATIGRKPSEIGKEALLALGGPTSPIKAIRAKCVDCCCGDMSEVNKCTAIACPLWPFRMGTNVFHARAK